MSAKFECNVKSCKRIEDVQQECEEQFRSTFDHMNDGLLVLNHAGHVMDANRTAYEHLGYSREELLGMHIAQLDCPEHVNKVAEKFALVNYQGHALFESAHRRKDGKSLPVEVNVRVIDVNEEQVYFCVIRDLTERKDNERALQIMQLSVDNMADGAFWITHDARIAYANAAACNALGYSREEMISLQVFDLDPKMSPETWPVHWNKTRMQGSRTVESTHRTKCGKLIPVEITINHLLYEGEEYHCSFVRDISQRKQEQRALKMMQFAMDNTADAVFWSAQGGRIAYANIAACRSLGYSLDEMLSLNIFDFAPGVSAESWPAMWSQLKEHTSLTRESTHRSKNGHVFPVEISTNHM